MEYSIHWLCGTKLPEDPAAKLHAISLIAIQQWTFTRDAESTPHVEMP